MNKEELRKGLEGKYDWVGVFENDGVAVVSKGNVLGFVNKEGELVCRCKCLKCLEVGK